MLRLAFCPTNKSIAPFPPLAAIRRSQALNPREVSQPFAKKRITPENEWRVPYLLNT